MKVQELLNEKLGFDPKRKMPIGSNAEWMKAIGATPEDIKGALEEVRESPEYKELVDSVGFVDASTAGNNKVGSIKLVGEYAEPRTIGGWVNKKTNKPAVDADLKGVDFYKEFKYATIGVDKLASPFKRKLNYTVQPHGKIDFTAPNGYHRWPVPSGKTRVVAGNPKASIVSSMRMALRDLLRQVGNKIAAAEKVYGRFGDK